MAMSFDNEEFFTKIFEDGKTKFRKAIFSDAIKHFQYCLNRYYRVSECYFYLGLSQFYDSNFKEAFLSFQMSMVFPGEFRSGTHYYLGYLCDILGNHSDAQMYYKRAIDDTDSSLYPLMAYKALSRYEEDERYKRRSFQTFAIQLALSPREKFLMEAFQASISGDLTVAEECFVLAKEEDRGHFEPYFYLALFYFYCRRYQDSQKYWAILERNFHISSLGLSERMHLFYELGEYRKALDVWRVYKKIVPSPSARQYFRVGLLHTRLSQFRQAILCYETAVNQRPDYFEALFNLGVCFQKSGEFLKAINIYSRAFVLEQDNPTPLYNIGMIYFEQKEYVQALFYLHEALSISPNWIELKENIRYIEYLHALDDKGFSNHNRALLIWVLGLLALILGLLGVLHMGGII